MYNPNNFYNPYHLPPPAGPLRGVPRRSPHRGSPHQALFYPRVPSPEVSTTTLDVHHQHLHARPHSQPRQSSMIVHDGYSTQRGRSLSRSRSRARRHSHSRVRVHRRSGSRGGWGSSEEEIEQDVEDEEWVDMGAYRDRVGFEVGHRSRSHHRFHSVSRSRSRSRGRNVVEREVITHYRNIDHGTVPAIGHHGHHNYSHGHETFPLRTRYLSDPVMTFRQATLRSPWRVTPGFQGPTTEIFRELVDERRLAERGFRYHTGDIYFCVEGYLSPEVMRDLVSVESNYFRRRGRSRRGYR